MINPSPNSSSKRSYPPVSGGSVPPPPPAPGFPAQPGYSGPAPGYPPSIPASGYPPAPPAYPASMAHPPPPPPPPMMGYPPGASPGGFVPGGNLHPGWGGSPSLSGPSPPASQSAAPPHSPTSAALTGGARRKLYPDQAKTAYETPATYSSQPPPPVMGGGGGDLGYAQPGVPAAPGMISPLDGMSKQFGQLNLSSNNVVLSSFGERV